MNVERLLLHYNEIADAPDAIARLRRFILDLAVRGKLLPQEPKDEPASTWWLRTLGNNVAERGKNSKTIIAPLEEVAAAHSLPDSWVWMQLGRLVTVMDAGWSPQCENHPRSDPDKWGVLKTTAVQTLAFDFMQHKELPSKLAPRPQHEAQIDDILVTRAGPKNRVGVSCVVDRTEPRLMISDKLIRFRLIEGLSPRFFALVLNAGVTNAAIEEAKSGMAVMQMNISQDKLRAVPVPLAPLAEQYRIVAKVDELMALCDRLETARMSREAARDRLTAASLARLNAPDPETFQTDAHFALDALPTLTTRPDQIKQIRQIILNLAVRGQLVPQDEKNEPASELLGRIAIDFERLVGEGKLNRPKPVKPVSESDYSLALPSGWSVARFNQIAAIQSNLVDPKRFKNMPHIAPDNIESWTARLLPYVSVGEAEVFSSKHHFSAGVILYSKIRPNLAKVTKVDFEGLCSADMYPIQPLINRAFLVTFMITADFVDQAVREDNRIAMPKINQAALSDILVPIPPLAEQRLIVTKVDALMALCDRLEASLTTAADTRRRLLDALLAEALAPAENRELEAAE